MIPSLDDRLDSMARALTEVVLPSLGSDHPLAVEQTHLVLAHIGIIREQLDRAPLFERREAEAAIALGKTLASLAQGGPLTTAAGEALGAAIDAASLDTPASVRDATLKVGRAIDALIDASLDDGSAAFRAASLKETLAAGHAAAMADRAWGRSVGFEANDVELPVLDLTR